MPVYFNNSAKPVKVSDTAPSNPKAGDLWYNSAVGKILVYYDGFWVLAPGGGGTSSGANGGRDLLTSNRTYYVRTDGDNDNDGLANTSDGAWATLQHAWDWAAANLDIGAYTVTIQVGTGTFAGLNAQSKPNGSMVLVGNTTTPSNVVITPNAGSCLNFFNQPNSVSLGGFRCALGTATGVVASNSVVSITGRMEFTGSGGNARPLMAIYGGQLYIWYGTPVSFDGTFSRGVTAYYQAYCEFYPAITLVAGTSFSNAFAFAAMNSSIEADHAGITGTATGKRYDVTTNSVIETFAGGANHLPGATSGTTATGGQYV